MAMSAPRPDFLLLAPGPYGLMGLALTIAMVSCTSVAGTASRPEVDAPAGLDLAVVETLAVFTDARDLSLGPDHTIFVTDAGTHTLSIISGSVVQRHGGPGTREGQFDEPLSVDPTNGLVILVADAGNGRIQRFSREFRPLGVIPVDATAFEASSRPPGMDGEQRQSARSDQGRPVSVVTSSSNEVFAIDATTATVLKWDATLRPVQVIGGFGARDGRLVDPVALATDGNRFLFVLDPGQSAVVVFDLFGTFLRRLAAGLVEDGRSIAVRGDRIYVTLPRTIYVFEMDGTMMGAWRPDLNEPLIDASPGRDSILILTRERLYSAVPARVADPFP